MSAQPATRHSAPRHPTPRHSAARHPPPHRAPLPRSRPAPARTARLEARRRRRHLQRLRRDLLVDFTLAFALTIALVIITAGLGVIALLEIPVAAGVIASFVLQRRRLVKKPRHARKIDHGRR